MAYLGNAPARSFISFERQVFTIVNSQTAYTLSHSVTNENDIRLVVNNIVQEPGSGKAYTASGTTLTLSAALTNGTDEMYCVFLGRAVGTVNAPAGSVAASQLAADSVTAAKLNDDIISGQTALASEPADTDEFLVSDAGTLKRIDYSLIKSSPAFTLIKETNASNVAAVTFQNGTDSVVFDSTYKVYFLTVTNLKLASDEELFYRALSGGSALTSGYWTAQVGTYGSSTPNTYNDRYENAFMGTPGDAESSFTFSSFMYIYNVGQSSAFPQAMGQVQMKRSNGNYYGFSFSGSYNTAISNFDGFTITNNGGGNISSGNFKLYGIT